MNMIYLVGGNDLQFSECIPPYAEQLGVRHIIVVISPMDGAQYHAAAPLVSSKIRTDIIKLISPTVGSLCSALFAIDDINNNDELIIVEGPGILPSSVHSLVADARSRGQDAATLTLTSLPPVTWFRAGGDFVTAAIAVLELGVTAKVSYSISEAVQVLRKTGKQVEIAEPPASQINLHQRVDTPIH